MVSSVKREFEQLGTRLYGLSWPVIPSGLNRRSTNPFDPDRVVESEPISEKTLIRIGNEEVSVDTVLLARLINCPGMLDGSHRVKSDWLVSRKYVPIVGTVGAVMVGASYGVMVRCVNWEQFTRPVSKPYHIMWYRGAFGLALVSIGLMYKVLDDWTEVDPTTLIAGQMRQLNRPEVDKAWRSWHKSYRRSRWLDKGLSYLTMSSVGSLFGLLMLPSQRVWNTTYCSTDSVAERAKAITGVLTSTLKLSRYIAVPIVLVLGCSIGYQVYRYVNRLTDGQVDKFNRVHSLLGVESGV